MLITRFALHADELLRRGVSRDSGSDETDFLFEIREIESKRGGNLRGPFDQQVTVSDRIIVKAEIEQDARRRFRNKERIQV